MKLPASLVFPSLIAMAAALTHALYGGPPSYLLVSGLAIHIPAGIIAHRVARKGIDPSKRAGGLLTVVIIKMLVSMVTAVVLIYLFPKHRQPFILHFVSQYILFSIFEIIHLKRVIAHTSET